MASDINIKKTIPFFWVMNINQSLHFYINQLGFTIQRQWLDDGKLRWCSVQREEALLMLQEFWKKGTEYNLPRSPLGIGVSIYFQCEDAIELYKEFRSRQTDAGRPFVGNGMWVTELHDPDGYSLFFESLTDEPEGSLYEG
jgi:lactoylglutathione lyase